MRSQGRNQERSWNILRDGRGWGGQNNSTQKKYNNNKLKDKKIKFYPYSKGQQQTSTYETVLKHILRYIQQQFKLGYNIVKTLRIGQLQTFENIETFSGCCSSEIWNQFWGLQLKFYTILFTQTSELEAQIVFSGDKTLPCCG